MRFSERYGYKPVREALQIECMDEALKNRLWNIIYSEFICRLERSPARHKILERFWSCHLKHPIDTIPDSYDPYWKWLRDYFFECKWNEIYDFLEFLVNENDVGRWPEEFKNECNVVLEQEASGYRFVGYIITQITQPEEIAAIEGAMEFASPFIGVRTHLDSALSMLADRKQPDHRNSIKESISAVESMACLIAEKPKADLSDALRALKDKGVLDIHPALYQAFEKLYAYTSDADGIRHKLIDFSNATLADAIYMLGACASFISYMIAKCGEAGIELKSK